MEKIDPLKPVKPAQGKPTQGKPAQGKPTKSQPQKTSKKAATSKVVSPAIEAPSSPLDVLSDMQKVWMGHYVRCWNATEAARLAGYRDPGCSGWENKQNPLIQAAIEAELDEHLMSAREVIQRLTDQARGVHSRFYRLDEDDPELDADSDFDTENPDEEEDGKKRRKRYIYRPPANRKIPHLDMKALVEAGYGHLIKKFKAQNGYITEIEFYDAQAALIAIGRHHKLFVDRTEHSGSIATPIGKDDLDPLDGLDRAGINRRIEEKIKAAGSGQ